MSVQSQPVESINVVGEGVSVAVPDAVELTVAIRAAAATITQALREHVNRTVSLMQALTARGVGPGDVRTTGVTVVPLFSTQLPGFPGVAPTAGGYAEMPPSGYQAVSTARVAIHDVNRLAELLDAVTATSPQLTMALFQKVTDESAVRRLAVEAALKDARAKAQAIAVATGKQLAEPFTVTEDAGAPPMNGSAPAAPGAAAYAAGPSLAGEFVVRASVRVSYGLR